MDILKFDLQKPGQPFKCLNAANGGPWHKRHSKKQYRSNFDHYQQARIPYSRNHDSAACGGTKNQVFYLYTITAKHLKQCFSQLKIGGPGLARNVSWTEAFGDSVRAIHGLKNASFMIACMASAQNSPINMLMYYDTRPSAFNGIFDFYTYEPLKGYYALCWYGKFYDMQQQIPAENALKDIYALCGTDADGKMVATTDDLTFDMAVHSAIFIREV